MNEWSFRFIYIFSPIFYSWNLFLDDYLFQLINCDTLKSSLMLPHVRTATADMWLIYSLRMVPQN